MALCDFAFDQLVDYKPKVEELSDFDNFSKETRCTARLHPLDATFSQVDFGLSTIDTYDVPYNGYEGQPIQGWLLLPLQRREKLP